MVSLMLRAQFQTFADLFAALVGRLVQTEFLIAKTQCFWRRLLFRCDEKSTASKASIGVRYFRVDFQFEAFRFDPK